VYFAIGAIVVILMLLIASPVSIHAKYIKNETLNEGIIFLRLLFIKIPIYKSGQSKREIDDKENDKIKEKSDFTFETFKQFVKILYALFKDLKKKITVDIFEIDINFGLGDAAKTGITTGVIYAAVYNMLALFDHNFILKKQYVNVVPNFNNCLFNIEFKSEFSVKLYYLIKLALKYSDNFKSMNLEI